MNYKWNKDYLEKHYSRIKSELINSGFTDDEVESPYLDKLDSQTKSKRILKMIRLAYGLGELHGIKSVDEGFTPIEIDPFELNFTEPKPKVKPEPKK